MSTGAFGPSPMEPLFHGLQSINKHWGMYVTLGILLIVLGFIAMAYAFAFSVASVMVVGTMILGGGILHAIHAFGARAWSGFLLSLLVSILYIACGVLMLTNPALSAITLTLFIAGFLIVAGIFRVVSAVALQFPSWGWVVVNGIIAFILGLMLWRQWPVSGLWVIGTFVGIEMIVSGWSTIMLATTTHTAARRLASPETGPGPAAT